MTLKDTELKSLTNRFNQTKNTMKIIFKTNSVTLFAAMLFIVVLSSCSDKALTPDLVNLDEIDETENYFTKGNGTLENPYQVFTIHQLQVIGLEKYLDKHFIQVNDIDASPSAEFHNGYGFKHIGTKEKPFTGSYDGNGYKIRDFYLRIQRSGEHTGMFGYVKKGTIKNVTIENQLPNHKNNHAARGKNNAEFKNTGIFQPAEAGVSTSIGLGGLIGYNDGGTLSNSSFTGSIIGYVGTVASGLVGINAGLIENSFFNGHAGGGASAGLTGHNLGTIQNSYATGYLDGMTAYGLVTVNDGGTIIRSFADMDLWGSNGSAGLVGFNDGGRIEESYATFTARGHQMTSGFVVYNNGEILNSYSQVKIDHSFIDHPEYLRIGGFVAVNMENGLIEYSYAAGEMSFAEETEIFGAFAAVNEGIITSSFWDLDLSGLSNGVGEGNSAGIHHLHSLQMTGSNAETNMPEFDWATVWQATDNYPILRWQLQGK